MIFQCDNMKYRVVKTASHLRVQLKNLLFIRDLEFFDKIVVRPINEGTHQEVRVVQLLK